MQLPNYPPEMLLSYPLISSVNTCISLHFHQNWCHQTFIISNFYFWISHKWKQQLHFLVLLICISLIWNDLEHLFICLLVRIVNDLVDSHGQVSIPGRDSYAGTEAKNGGKYSKIYSVNTYCALTVIKVLWPHKAIPGGSGKTFSYSLSGLKILSAPR